MNGNAYVTNELAVFLRTRRERLAPDDLALPRSGRSRRTPGLRREEVAELAGVSVDYVIRLEQGRGLRPSPEVLDGLAGALRLSDDERAYLFDLVGQRAVTRVPPSRQVPPPVARLVHDLSPLPCMLLDHRFDILAWNREMAALMMDFGAVPARQRNSLWLCFVHPGLHDFYRDRERVMREGIADLRAAWAAHTDDAALGDLVTELQEQSEEFVRLWALRDVKVNGRGRKPLMHPRVGPLTVDFEVLNPLQDPGHRLVIYRASDAASQAALDAIAREAEDGPRTLHRAAG
ncbi:helix-turn-helix transcriptional regulator [Streptosporangium sp. NPDC001559]|uniref:helix-turn-helix transcriptional regulator n=1 Tax=Streptosporangium sp. NPDC001559 TaxID=3366187 RepID=UPI0036E50A79